MSASGARRVTLPPDETAPARAREFLRAVRSQGNDTTVLEDATLLVSELVTNAVRHAAPPITLEVASEAPDGLSIRVTDGSPLPPSGRALTSDQESGRGMALVDVLSEDWGVEPAEPGKAVWFRLAPPGHAPGHSQDGHSHDGHSHDGHSHDGAGEATLDPPTREPTLAS